MQGVSKVAAYGTLRYKQHAWGDVSTLLDSGYVAETVLDGFTLHDAGSFPMAIHGEGRVVVDVFEIDDGLLESMDRIEGHPSFFKRELVKTDEGMAWMYLCPEAYGYPEISSGDWNRR